MTDNPMPPVIPGNAPEGAGSPWLHKQEDTAAPAAPTAAADSAPVVLTEDNVDQHVDSFGWRGL